MTLEAPPFKGGASKRGGGGKPSRHTGSAQAKRILDNWRAYLGKFVKVFPHEYRRALGELALKGNRLAA